jgi:hypothetical protein
MGMKTRSAAPEPHEAPVTPMKIPEENTWWVRTSSQKRYFLRQIHEVCGRPYVWIYQEGVNRCYHLPLTTLLKKYRQLHVGPIDPATGNTLNHLN